MAGSRTGRQSGAAQGEESQGEEPSEAQGTQGAESLSFEDSLRELEAVAQRLESGGVGLEESLRLLKRGMALLERCEGELSAAEAVLEQLVLNDDGELETVRLGTEDE